MIPLRALKATAGWAGNSQESGRAGDSKANHIRLGLEGASVAPIPAAKEGPQ